MELMKLVLSLKLVLISENTALSSQNALLITCKIAINNSETGTVEINFATNKTYLWNSNVEFEIRIFNFEISVAFFLKLIKTETNDAICYLLFFKLQNLILKT